MTINEPQAIDLATPTGPMRTYVLSPSVPGRYPGVVPFSERFQVTGPIRRTAAIIAGHGYVVAVPEIYHEFEPPGVALAGQHAFMRDEGNRYDPELARICYGLVLELFHRRL